MTEEELLGVRMEQWGFKNDSLETKEHIITYVFYDIGRLMIKGKKRYSSDDVYIEDYFTTERFKSIIEVVTREELI